MRRTTCILILFLTAFAASGQSIEEWQRQIDDAKKEIDAANRLLSSTRSEQQGNRSRWELVQGNIANRRKIIVSFDEQIRLVNRRINANTQAIAQMNRELGALKTEYAALIRAAYRNQQSHQVLSFLFAAEDFNDVTRRIFLIKRYTRIREQRAVQIDSVSRRLRVDSLALNLQKDSLRRIVAGRTEELASLEREEREFRRIDTTLGSRVQQYNRQIAEQQRTIEAMQRQVAELIRRSQAAAAARSAAEEEVAMVLTGQFAENRGRLPYPAGGVIPAAWKFGRHLHPNSREVMVDNQGVRITTERGAPVRAVFEGIVDTITGEGRFTVLIRHGNYITAYSNLETVSVRPRQQVSTGQPIGTVDSSADSRNHFLWFSVFNGSQALDPEQWIRR